MANENFDAPAIAREIGKKKRSNRSARLKQCKLDARREQWLSQVKKGNEERATIPVSPTSPLQRTSQSKSTTKKERSYSNAPTLDREELTNLENSDLESPTHNNCKNNNPTTNNSGSITSSCTGSSIGSYSRSVSDAEEEEDYEGDELDDWETIADALSTSPNSSSHHHVHSPMSTDSFEDTKHEPGKANSRTWRPSDEFRPQSLPNIMNHRTFNPPPQLSCPICYEDLDFTDSSFLPCECGFHVCLFCHKRILEADARCPGCRKQYKTVTDGEEIGVVTGLGGPPLVYRFTRSCSLKNRY